MKTNDISRDKAATLVAHGGTRPANISPARWAAIVRHVTREILNK